jgi:predicted amidophosphoribosyltransferase
VTAYAYDDVVRSVILEAKYRGAYRAFDCFVPVLVAYALRLGAIDAVVAPPPAAAHFVDRGYDPAGYLARRVARALQLPVASGLARVGHAQTGRAASERRRGPQVAARRGVPRRILIVDDVVTTGATLAAVAAAVRDVGAERCVALAAARADRASRF